MITDTLDSAFAKADSSQKAEPSGGGAGLLPAGQYEGVVVSAEVRDGFRPWVEQELSLRLTVDAGAHSGSTTFCDIEIAPLTTKDGTISEGKMNYVRWQITDVLGYDGKLSELAQHASRFIGARLAFEQKITLANKINPNTGAPYENREVTLKASLGAGDPAAAAGVPAFEPAPVTIPDDDDIPF